METTRIFVDKKRKRGSIRCASEERENEDDDRSLKTIPCESSDNKKRKTLNITNSKCDGVFYANSDSGPLAYENYDSSTHTQLRCLDCDTPLHYRRQHTKTINGISVVVRSCFAHNPTKNNNLGNYNACGGGESIEHKYAKHVVRKFNDFIKYYTPCVRCHKKVYIDLKNGKKENASFVIEHKWNDFYIDVGVCIKTTDEEENYCDMVGAVEILHTHVTTAEKKRILTDSGVAWIEIRSSDVLNLAKEINDIELKDVVYDILVVDHGGDTPKCIACQTKGIEEDAQLMHSSESWYMSSAKRVLDENALIFGKYYGLTVKEIAKIDMPYVRWLAGYTGKRLGSKPIAITYNDNIFKIQPLLQTEARKVMIGICLLCYIKCDESWKNWCSSCYRDSS